MFFSSQPINRKRCIYLSTPRCLEIWSLCWIWPMLPRTGLKKRNFEYYLSLDNENFNKTLGYEAALSLLVELQFIWLERNIVIKWLTVLVVKGQKLMKLSRREFASNIRNAIEYSQIARDPKLQKREQKMIPFMLQVVDVSRSLLLRLWLVSISIKLNHCNYTCIYFLLQQFQIRRNSKSRQLITVNHANHVNNYRTLFPFYCL